MGSHHDLPAELRIIWVPGAGDPTHLPTEMRHAPGWHLVLAASEATRVSGPFATPRDAIAWARENGPGAWGDPDCPVQEMDPDWDPTIDERTLRVLTSPSISP